MEESNGKKRRLDNEPEVSDDNTDKLENVNESERLESLEKEKNENEEKDLVDKETVSREKVKEEKVEIDCGEKEEKAEECLSSFYKEVRKEQQKKVELKTSQSIYSDENEKKMTGIEHIERLLRPGSSYFNLNPYNVLRLATNASLEQISKKYRRLAALIHPDKNPDDVDRAQLAFEAINNAHKKLLDTEQRKVCLDIIAEAEDKLKRQLEEKREHHFNAKIKMMREDDAAKLNLKSIVLEEDDPEVFSKLLYRETCKLFAKLERLRVAEEAKRANERKRKFEEEEYKKMVEEEKKLNQKRMEETRNDRRTEWTRFTRQQMNKKKKNGNVVGIFRPPTFRAQRK
ncbi:hypothetical protein SNEBB_011097 [Seison nebaliae]|nr:hypothetical protein SNEBB_011097 [Seison nebaliae]